MKQLSYESVKNAYQKFNYPFPVHKDKVFLKITGIRTNNLMPDVYDDYLVFCYEDPLTGGAPVFFGGMATTHPGVFYLTNPMNPAGSAVIVPGFYPNVWARGIHHPERLPKHRAFIQIKDFKLWRDNDKNNFLPDMKKDVNGEWHGYDKAGNIIPIVDSGLSAINLHSTRSDLIDKFMSVSVGKWSAGCQVMQDWKKKEKACDIGDLHIKNFGNTFNYALFAEDDF